MKTKSENPVKKALTEKGAIDKLHKAMKYIGEETEIAKRGEFGSQTDVEYLSNGRDLLDEFYGLLVEVLG